MKWIVLVIVVSLAVYTYLTLHYRKTTPPFRPNADIRARANVIRLLSAGYQRITLVAQRPADSIVGESGAVVTTALGGIPADLRTTLVDQPSLPTDIVAVAAAPLANALLAYPIRFTCALPDNQRQLAGADLYVKGEALYLVPTFEQLGGELRARTRETVVLLTIPAGTLKPGRYEALLIGERASKSWTLQVR